MTKSIFSLGHMSIFLWDCSRILIFKNIHFSVFIKNFQVENYLVFKNFNFPLKYFVLYLFCVFMYLFDKNFKIGNKILIFFEIMNNI